MNIHKKNLAVFVSGSGSNFAAVQDKIESGSIHADIKIVISNNSDAYALERAKQYGIDSCVINQKLYPDNEELTQQINQKLDKYNIDYIILAGYLKKIPKEIVKNYQYKIINIHPALLPKFGGKGMYGIHVHEAVLQAGEKTTGVTVHFIDEQYDNGPNIIQKEVDVREDDTPEQLQKRVLDKEHELLPKVVQLLCNNKITIKDNQVHIEGEQ